MNYCHLFPNATHPINLTKSCMTGCLTCTMFKVFQSQMPFSRQAKGCSSCNLQQSKSRAQSMKIARGMCLQICMNSGEVFYCTKIWDHRTVLPRIQKVAAKMTSVQLETEGHEGSG